MTRIRHFFESHRFVVRIVVPTLLAIALFVAAIFAFLVPAFERNLLDRKREMIRELTNSAWSILAEFEKEEREGLCSREDAQRRAKACIEFLRYGEQSKDYFWISDLDARMVMHPYRKNLNGRDVSDLEDSNGKKIFVEFANVVRAQGHGYVDYDWQWKDDPDHVAAKESYVRGFEPWGWIIGTGLYVDDVRQEIAAIEARVIHVSSAIAAVMVLLLLYTAHQSLRIERQRQLAETGMRESSEKYRTLVEAATDGTLMVLEGKIFYANKTILDMLGYEAEDFARLDIARLIAPDEEEPEAEASGTGGSRLLDLLAGKQAPGEFHARLVRRNGERLDAVLTASTIAIAGRAGFILIVRETVRQRKAQEEREHLIAELQASLLFLNEPIDRASREAVACDMRTPIRDAAALMTKQGASAIFVRSESGEAIGIVTDHDMRERVVAARRDAEGPIFEIMSSPLVSISHRALTFEAILQAQESGVRHLAVRDAHGRVVGAVRNKELLRPQQYSAAFLTREIHQARSVEEIVACRERQPRLVRALIDCGAKSRNISRILTTVSDSILDKFIGFAIEDLGAPPCRFAFIALGSEGREEETLTSDQDNAIVFEDSDADEAKASEAYFLKMGERVCGWLDAAGYAFCKGGVMAKTPKWCRPLADWKRHFRGWITEAEPQALLEFNMFFDFRCIWGASELTASLRRFIGELMATHPPFFLHMAQNTQQYKPPLGFFGNIVADAASGSSRSVHLKEAMMPIVNFARLYALKSGIEETNTIERLRRLYDAGVLQKSFCDEIVASYAYLMEMRLAYQARAMSEGGRPDNSIDLGRITQIEESMLKQAFAQIATMQKRTSRDFLGST